MSVQNIVLYGAVLYDPDTYSTNQDPQSFTATLTDTTALSDSELQQAVKAVADSLTASDARVIAVGVKPLSDTATLGEILVFVQNSIRFMTDSLIVADSKIALRQIKGLSDFVLLNDWIELKLVRAGIWQSTPAFGFKPSNIHLYGPGVYYGVDFYSSNPTVAWLVSTPAQTTWEMEPTVGAVLPLYGQTQYGPQPYSATPEASWTKPISTARQAWTNANGESHN